MEGWLLRDSSEWCASPSNGSCWKNKVVFMRADSFCFWRQSNNDVIVAIVSFSSNSNHTLPLKHCGSLP